MKSLTNQLTKRAHLAQIFAIVLVALSPAICAADDVSGASGSKWSRSFLIGVAALPAYFGDDQLQGTALPDVRLQYDDRFEASLFFGAQYSVFRNGNWSAGPVLRYDFGRDEREGNPLVISGSGTEDLLGLGDVGASFEAGGFLTYENQRWRVGMEVRQGLNGGHEGLVGVFDFKLNGTFGFLGRRGFFKIGPELLYADADYNQTYFGITQEQATNSGLSPYMADSGIVRYGLHADLLVPVSESTSLGMFANVDRLGGPAADSPLIIERGSEVQYRVGLFVARVF